MKLMSVDQWMRDHAGQGFVYVHPRGGMKCSMQCSNGDEVKADTPALLVDAMGKRELMLRAGKPKKAKRKGK